MAACSIMSADTCPATCSICDQEESSEPSRSNTDGETRRGLLRRTPSKQHVSPATTDVSPTQLTLMILVTYSVCITADASRSPRSLSSSAAFTSSRNFHPWT
eukprot:803540-Prymnesium_polylepis.1